MRVPLSWLRELTPLKTRPTDRTEVAALAADFDALGLVVEGVERVGEGLGEVVLARVLEIAAIPKADRIRRVVVDAGGAEPVEVVCGAWNFEVGDVVPFAPVGTVLPGEFRIEQRRLRGVVSNGMLCSGRELRLSDDHEGILVLGRVGADGSREAGAGAREAGEAPEAGEARERPARRGSRTWNSEARSPTTWEPDSSRTSCSTSRSRATGPIAFAWPVSHGTLPPASVFR